jgi:hypothetical protein
VAVSRSARMQDLSVPAALRAAETLVALHAEWRAA